MVMIVPSSKGKDLANNPWRIMVMGNLSMARLQSKISVAALQTGTCLAKGPHWLYDLAESKNSYEVCFLWPFYRFAIIAAQIAYIIHLNGLLSLKFQFWEFNLSLHNSQNH